MLWTIYTILARALEIYQFAVVIYILMSWFPGARDSAVGRIIANIVEPYLEPFRRIIPPLGMIDISPIVAILVLRFAENGLFTLFRFIA